MSRREKGMRARLICNFAISLGCDGTIGDHSLPSGAALTLDG
jgi:hypothetical protein